MISSEAIVYENISVIAIFAFLYSVTAGRLERTPINGPVVYLVFGLIAGPLGFGLLDLEIGSEGIRLVAELTLALVLFADASSADMSVLRQTRRLPLRLLLVGLPLTILLGVGAGVMLFPELGLLEVMILATMLAPTDAALGKAVVSNPVVPATVREGLNVESGLNDGICVPILFTFLALASGAGGEASAGRLALELVAEEIGIGALVGVGFAFAAARGLRMAFHGGWLADPWLRIVIVAVAFGCFSLAQSVHGSGFIACFVGGLTFGALAGEHKHAVLEGAEVTGEGFALVTWVIFGAAVVGQHSGTINWQVVTYALLSLTVIRMLPVFVAVSGLGARTDSKLFLGWFGPRGLASIVFGVIVLGYELPGGDILIGATVVTVFLSIIAHGISASPLAAAFGARAKSEADGAS
jgi:NhaP-type Na+/H+ or K+/H+ antiporter